MSKIKYYFSKVTCVLYKVDNGQIFMWDTHNDKWLFPPFIDIKQELLTEMSYSDVLKYIFNCKGV